MKKSLLLLFVGFVLLFIVSNCTTLSRCSPAITNGVELNSDNFEYVRSVQAESSRPYIFSIGGGNTERMAIDQVKEEANLQPNQALTNYVVTNSTKVILLGIVIIKTTKVTADVVQFHH